MKNKVKDDDLDTGGGGDDEYAQMLASITASSRISGVGIGSSSSGSRPSGGFFKYLNNTHFDLDKFGIHKEVKKEHYNENCLYLAFKYGGMYERKLEV